METNNETPKRRLEDVTPAETIDWSAPGAPAVPAAAGNAKQEKPRVAPVAVFEGYDGDTGEPIVKLLGEVQPGAKLYLGSLVPSPVPPVPAPAPQAQPLIGRLLDEFSELPVLWGLNEPGALVRHSDVFKMLVAAGKAQAAPAVPVNAAPSDDEWPTPADLLAEHLENIAEQWTECIYDAPGEMIDIGASLRREFAKLDLAHLARHAQPTDRDAVLEEAAAHITRGNEQVRSNGWVDAANERARCAAAIRALKSGSTTEGAGNGEG